MSVRVTVSILLCLQCLSSTPVAGQTAKRHILALYDSGQGQSPKSNHIHNNAEVILNHLGCVVDYWDIQKGLPDPNQMDKYLGVMTWFYANQMRWPVRYIRWASEQVAAGRKYVILGNIGAFVDRETGKTIDINLINQFCKLMGFRVDNTVTTNEMTRIELVYKDAKMVEFERTLDYELQYFIKLTLAKDPGSNVYLKLKRNDIPKCESSVVFTTSRAGVVASSYAIFEDPYTHKRKWRINPFRFFNEAFGLSDLPRADVTTLNGLRIWCSHIDGDALISLSEVKRNTYCGEIIRDQIIKKYKWPISVSVVVGEVEQSPKFVDIARSIYRIEWVEAASHSYAHPFYWSEDYENKAKYASRHMLIDGYTFNLEKEVVGSVSYINDFLLPPNKKVEQFFWTGNCEPQPEALAFCQKINISNINGGDAVFDNKEPSYTSVTPLGVDVGGYHQIYSPNSNENIYTNEWTGPYYGFRFVLDTFKNTESPVRIKPINIYYHFYSGEKWAALNALKEVIDKSIVQDVAPMFISDYISTVEGFHSAEIQKVSGKSWRLTNFGKCTTFRFDDNQMFPDFRNSSSVLGFTHYQGSLYVHLEETDEAVITLTESKPDAVYLEQGSHRIYEWSASKEKVLFKTEGFGKGRFLISNLLGSRTYRVATFDANAKKKTAEVMARTDLHGKLLVLHQMQGPLDVGVSLADENHQLN